jgi:hypothetical protein
LRQLVFYLLKRQEDVSDIREACDFRTGICIQGNRFGPDSAVAALSDDARNAAATAYRDK